MTDCLVELGRFSQNLARYFCQGRFVNVDVERVGASDVYVAAVDKEYRQ